jgi:GT2 family glycosyltransferase
MSNICLLVLSYNHPQHTRECIESIVATNTQHPIILIHNGSEQKWIDQLKQQFPKIEHFTIQQNAGFSNGANLGLQHAFERFEWAIFFTNDTLARAIPAKLELAAGLYAPVIWRRKVGVIDSMGARFNPYQQKLWHCRSAKDFSAKSPFSYPYVPGTAFILHRDIWLAVGAFDESLHTYWEDVDFSVRVYRQHLKMGLFSEFELVHKVGKTCHKSAFYTNHLFQRNRKIISHRYNKLFQLFQNTRFKLFR